MSYWAVVYTDVAAEPDVRRDLEELGYGTFLPWYRQGKWHGDQLIIRNMPLIPRYVFVHLPDNANWTPVANTDGVKSILMTADKPGRVSPSEIADLTIKHATGHYNAIAPYRGANGRYRKRRKRRRRPRPGKVVTGRPTHT